MLIKGKAPFPFEVIAVGLAFSPRSEALFCETIRIVKLFKAKLIIIYIGKRTNEKETSLSNLIQKYNLENIEYKIIFEEGEVVERMLKICKENLVDLLIAGALEKESMIQYYVGSVSREICRQAKCSLLMITNPSFKPIPFSKIIVNGTENIKTLSTLSVAINIAKAENVKEVYIVREINFAGFAMSTAYSSTEPEAKIAKQEIKNEEIKKLDTLISQLDKKDIFIKHSIISGKPGHAISHFAQSHNANLLVVNSPDKKLNLLDRIFTHDLEFVLENLPCTVLIVHSRLPKSN